MFLTLCLCLTVGLVVWLWQKDGRMKRMAQKLPGQRAYPLVGNGLQLGTTTSHFYEYVGRKVEEFGWSPFTLWFGPMLIVVVSDPKDIEIILSSNKLLEKGEMYEYLFPWLGTGLLTSTGDKWRKHRKIITPSFHFEILKDNVDVFNANGQIMVDNLRKQVNGAGFDIYKYITLCALDNICETAMGVKIDAQTNSESEYVNAVRNMSDVFMKRTTKPWYGVDWIFNLSSLKKLSDDSLKTLHSTTHSVIKSRREEMTREKAVQGAVVETQTEDKKRRLAFLDMLIESTFQGSQLTDVDIREEVDTFMFEGHDTTSSGISFALWLLSWHQDVQDKAYCELREVFPREDEPLTYRGLQDLKYMERVIKESLRLYPSVPLYARKVIDDVKLSGGHVIPRGATVSVAAFMSQRKPDIFPEPGKFDPDRFEADNAQGRHPYAYVPFSAGPRNCIGQKFAMLEMKATIAHVLRSYKLLPGTQKPDLQLALEVILISCNGIKVKIVPR